MQNSFWQWGTLEAGSKRSSLASPPLSILLKSKLKTISPKVRGQLTTYQLSLDPLLMGDPLALSIYFFNLIFETSLTVSTGWPGMSDADQVGLELTEIYLLLSPQCWT